MNSDTWLATYGGTVYTPKHRAEAVLNICRQFDDAAQLMPAAGYAPRGYVRIAVNVTGWKQRDALRGQLNFRAVPRINSDILFHPALLETPAPRRWVTNVIPLPTVWRGVQVVTVGERAGIGNPWLRDLRRARNLIYEATRGTSASLHPKSPLGVRLDIAEGRGLLAAAVESLPEYAAELAVAIGEASAALVVSEPASVEFLTHKAGYRVEKIYQQLLTAERSRAA